MGRAARGPSFEFRFDHEEIRMNQTTALPVRAVSRVIESVATSDGAGVKLRRSVGRGPEQRIDPFLMLDEFFSDDPKDYIAGFPPHPHRGFETVTYMLDGRMQHEDHLGNRGELVPGGVQWMSAARGIIHSEMPLQQEGRLRGFQLWINLPAKEKMKPPAYRDLRPDEIPTVALPEGGRARVITGELSVAGTTTRGPVGGITTDPLYVDIALPAGARFAHRVGAERNAFVYVYEGTVVVGEEGAAREVSAGTAAVLGAGEAVAVRAGASEARMLLLAARPIREPVVQYGPFVMNTQQEIRRAIEDYQAGRFEAAGPLV